MVSIIPIPNPMLRTTTLSGSSALLNRLSHPAFMSLSSHCIITPSFLSVSNASSVYSSLLCKKVALSPAGSYSSFFSSSTVPATCSSSNPSISSSSMNSTFDSIWRRKTSARTPAATICSQYLDPRNPRLSSTHPGVSFFELTRHQPAPFRKSSSIICSTICVSSSVKSSATFSQIICKGVVVELSSSSTPRSNWSTSSKVYVAGIPADRYSFSFTRWSGVIGRGSAHSSLLSFISCSAEHNDVWSTSFTVVVDCSNTSAGGSLGVKNLSSSSSSDLSFCVLSETTTSSVRSGSDTSNELVRSMSPNMSASSTGSGSGSGCLNFSCAACTGVTTRALGFLGSAGSWLSGRASRKTTKWCFSWFFSPTDLVVSRFTFCTIDSMLRSASNIEPLRLDITAQLSPGSSVPSFCSLAVTLGEKSRPLEFSGAFLCSTTALIPRSLMFFSCSALCLLASLKYLCNCISRALSTGGSTAAAGAAGTVALTFSGLTLSMFSPKLSTRLSDSAAETWRMVDRSELLRFA
ncbi:hypothetical protein OGAPHI_006264 [Ogataea philodendri]|uniref:Uncharacterized protein n=1 Tax=Ogataea philodendri TaxID=1378263 RepID=A0A9P8NY65_9ASCO|nr:uncharacterized protein OGAPHI_006264 [Ogataea philodendri]KAH3662083.1 hypothetical protein OGAPHI_006264 [Ogataea philodendri]